MMKKIILLLLIISCTILCNAQKSKIPLLKQDPKKVDASEFVQNKSTTIKTNHPNNVNQPILVVNNVVYKDSFDVRVKKLDTKNIETIQVLKDTAADNKYGTIAQYGVIEVVYKKPQNVKPTDKKGEILH